MTVSTGNDALDEVLDGGLPERRTTLVTGGPGTGKSTLGMQFLDTALDRGEECLFVSTEQSTEDVRGAFADFAFDVDHENLTIASIHAAPGTTLDGEDSLVLSELGEDEDGPFAGFPAPYEQEYVQRFLERYDDADCVVFDSASALLDLPGGRETARSSALELMEFFQHSLGATTIMTAEGEDVDPGVQRTLAYAAHGVVELDTEAQDGQSMRTLRVVKLRGAAHDRRKYGVRVDESGFHVVPERRSPVHVPGAPGTIPTGVPGLEDVVPGLPTGGANLVEHDGNANVEQFATAALARALDDGRRTVLVPSRFLTRDAVEESLPAGQDVEALLDDGDLIVIDPFGTWDASHENVVYFGGNESLFSMVTGRASPVTAFRLFRTVNGVADKLEGDPTFVVVFLEGLLRRASPSIIQRVSNWLLANRVTEYDAWWVFLNPGVTDESTVEFFRHDTRQRLRTWLSDDGLQRLRLEKGAGDLKTDHVVEWTEEPPYVRVERPF